MIVVLFGPPGSGKGTQAGVITTRLCIPHISTGDLFRAEITTGTPLGKQVAPILAAGSLVPDDLTVRILERRLDDPDAAGGALLDGFPRTISQAESLTQMLAAHGQCVDIVINLIVSDQELQSRVILRAAKDGRSDDNTFAFKRRMEVYHEQTEQVLGFYRESGTHVEDIDGIGEVQEITQRILACVEEKVT